MTGFPWWMWSVIGAIATGVPLCVVFLLLMAWAGWPRRSDPLAHKVKKTRAHEEVRRLDDDILRLVAVRKHIVKEARRRR